MAVAYRNLTVSLNSKYVDFLCGDKIVRFWTGAADGQRGIARTTRKQLKFFENRYIKRDSSIGFRFNKIVNYFPSIFIIPTRLPENSVIMIHDVTPIILRGMYTKYDYFLWERVLAPTVRKAAYIITISDSSKRDIHKHLDFPIDRIKVIPCDVSCSCRKFQPVSGLPKEYVLFVGAVDCNKNLDVVLRALQNHSMLHVSFVIVGDASKLVINNHDLQKRVVQLGRLCDEELFYVIERCVALVYPSKYEGFGLPPFEAALFKKPVICSRVPAMSEIWNDNELYFVSPDSAQDWVEAYLAIITDPAQREERIKNAFIKASYFSGIDRNQQLAEFLTNFDA